MAALCSVVAIPFWIFAASPWELAAGAFAMQFMVQGAWGVVPTHLTELSSPDVRGLFPGSRQKSAGYANALALVAAVVLVGGRRHRPRP